LFGIDSAAAAVARKDSMGPTTSEGIQQAIVVKKTDNVLVNKREDYVDHGEHNDHNAVVDVGAEEMVHVDRNLE
jgi:hypothetical protein